MSGSDRISGDRSRLVRQDGIETTHGAHETTRGRDRTRVRTDEGTGAPLGAGLEHTKDASVEPGVLLASIAEARSKHAKHLAGEEPFDAVSYAAVTGISVDRSESERLNALVRNVAARIGLDHAVGFAAETKYLGHAFEYSFVGQFQGWDRPKQTILVGIGLLAKTVEDVELLYRFFNHELGAPAALIPMLEDFLKLNIEERIEAILVHEKHELEAVKWGSSNPHRSAVFEAPETEFAVSPRVRSHLELYADCEEKRAGGSG